MTHRQGVVFGRDMMLRWLALAEQRLRHLTELFESGRWRQFYSERAFLENIREAKWAVEVWHDLSTGARSRRGIVWSVPAVAALPHEVPPVQAVSPKSVQIAPVTGTYAPSNPLLRPQGKLGLHADSVRQDQEPPAATRPMPAFMRDLDGIQGRYSLLQNSA